MVNKNKSAHIVVGLGYGDEGKGAATNHLCSTASNPIVIRFNGGHQAGHTVVLPNGKRHVFSSFGSGTLISVPTYWSSYCTVSPAHLLAEYDSLDVIPRLYIDENCPITTHYDVLYNRALETHRGSNRNGSCGVGFGATIDRHYGQKIPFRYGDIHNPKKIGERLATIKEYYRNKITDETDFEFNAFDHDQADQEFASNINELLVLENKKIINIVDETDIFNNKDWDTYIFEGAQGILLDSNFGTSPHVTKSNTSSKNAIDILTRNFREGSIQPEINIHYISRAYLTRHGAGPFPTFTDQLQIINNTEETNIYNEYQGAFRIGCLNIGLLNSALNWDNQFSSNFPKHLILTCLDQIPGPTISIYHNESILVCGYSDIPAFLDTKFKTISYSSNPSMNQVRVIAN
ncbi:adenylosuccinate synthetase [Pedobacter psychrodurus]|uniref:adenylosuccinate synthetase n=1 Tax=Pedobacter psychrodurus TaxID=2530456 RepID=UPI002930BAF8|nr:adenylosuccinate synthetase [Pedobacter psychrodurus]